MTMLWVGVGTAVLGAGASIYGSNKQASAAKKAAALNQGQFGINNAQQQPYIQSGYGAMSKLNTLLGLSPNPNPRAMMPTGPQAPQQAYAPTPGGGVEQRIGPLPSQPPPMWNVPEHNMPNLPLRSILALRASHGDRQAQQMLQRLG